MTTPNAKRPPSASATLLPAPRPLPAPTDVPPPCPHCSARAGTRPVQRQITRRRPVNPMWPIGIIIGLFFFVLPGIILFFVWLSQTGSGYEVVGVERVHECRGCKNVVAW